MGCNRKDKNDVVKVGTMKGTGRNRGRTCVFQSVEPGRNDRKTKGGGKLVDSGKRFKGCFTNKGKLAAAISKAKNQRTTC